MWKICCIFARDMKYLKMKPVLTLILFVMCCFSYGQRKLVALSFDDGPNTETTVRMLDMLKKHKVKASFFVIGKNINKKSAKVMKRAHREGHDIENHSLTHSSMPSLSADSMRSEINQTSALVEKYVGERPQFFRPPYIALNQTMFDNIELPFICGEGCNDWEAPVTADERAEKMLASARRTHLLAARLRGQREHGAGRGPHHTHTEGAWLYLRHGATTLQGEGHHSGVRHHLYRHPERYALD